MAEVIHRWAVHRCQGGPDGAARFLNLIQPIIVEDQRGRPILHMTADGDGIIIFAVLLRDEDAKKEFLK